MTKQIDVLEALGLQPLPSTSPDAITALVWAREVIQKHITTTYSVKSPQGIEELKPIKIGGVDQWVHIRGRNRDNPVLLWLHGGPGSPILGFADAIQRPWEDYFTVVQWDQRKTGKSYYPADDESTPPSVEQFITDTEEIIRYLRDHLKKDKLFILGSSWGSVLGMHMVKRNPSWLHSYIGVGQVVNSIENERMLFHRLLSHAKEKNEHELVAKLEAIIPTLDFGYPEREKANAKNSSFVRKELSRMAGETFIHHLPYDDTMKILNFERTISPHLTPTDLSNSILGDEIASYRPPNRFSKEILDVNLPKDIGSSFEVPIFFFTGFHDWQTSRVLSDKWFREINAPHKELIHFDESSHFVVNEEPGKFLVSLVNNVLPFSDT